MRAKQRSRLCVFATLSLALPLASCGGGGSGGGEANTASISGANADILLTDAAVHDLLSFRARVSSLVLERDDDTRTDNLLRGRVSVEFLGSEEEPEWMVQARIPAGTYRKAWVSFVPDSYRARSEDGTPVTVNAVSEDLCAEFRTPLTVDSEYRRVVIDLDLSESLEGDVSDGSILFLPRGDADFSDGDEDLPIDEIRGIVRSVDVDNRTLEVRGFVDDDEEIEIGPVTVKLNPNALILNDRRRLSLEDFSSIVSRNRTVVELHGSLTSRGQFRARRVKIEDLEGDQDRTAVGIEGVVVAVARDRQAFELMIEDIEKGEALAQRVLDSLGNDDGILEVSVNDRTVFLLDDSDEMVSERLLAAGQEVDVKFKEFMAPPFVAREVEIEDEGAQIEGTIVDIEELPKAIRDALG